MVKIRLSRAGAKKRPYYHIVATDSRNRRDGAFIEQLGSYDPMRDPAAIEIDGDRIDYWVKNGAQLSETVASLVKRVRAEAAEPQAS